MKRRLSALTAAGSVMWALSATAADPAQCDGPEVGPAPSTGYPLAPPRSREAWIHAGYAGDWRRGAGATPALTVGAEWVPFLTPEQRLRLGWYGGFLWGHWGDREHSSAGFDTSLRFRASFVMTDFFDGYLVAKGGIMGAFDPLRFGLRPGIGAGFRVLRAVALEATFDEVIALGDRFAGGSRVLPGITITLGVDLCIDCQQPPPPAATTHALACDLYRDAKGLCDSTHAHARLCSAVAAALDASTNVTSERYDDTDAFLSAMIKQVTDATELKEGLVRLRKRHRELLETWQAAREAERKAAQRGAWLTEHCTYGPTAIELRDALGCDERSRPAACRTVVGCEP